MTTQQPHSRNLPSWSWLGWEGLVWFPEEQLGRTMRDYTEPVAEWYTMGSPTLDNRRRINSVWHEYKLRAENPTMPLLQGWGRELNESFEEGGKTVGTFRKYCYRHMSSDARYGYPVPVLDPSEHRDVTPQTMFLYTQTSRAYLLVESESGNIKRGPIGGVRGVSGTRRLMNAEEKILGWLGPHNKGKNKLGYSDDEFDQDRTTRVELVAVCKGYSQGVADYRLSDTKWSEESSYPKNCYFVLWIEWQDGVAYRQGRGEVIAEDWEECKEKELVDLILG